MQQTDNTHSYYKFTESKWDSTRSVHGDISFQAFENYTQMIMRSVQLQPGSKVLDIGCGTGQMLEILKEHGFLVYGFDFASQKVKQAISRNPCIPIWKQSFLDTIRLESYDLIMSFSVIQYCLPKDIRQLFRNCVSAINRTGKIVHFSIPVIEKIEQANGVYFQASSLKEMSRIKQSILYANINSQSTFEDGTFFHSLSKIREITEDLGCTLKLVEEDPKSYRVNVCIERNPGEISHVEQTVSYF
jgi:cyclopropane fatty-acyl-phospholipid synthase-like methyltransferase